MRQNVLPDVTSAFAAAHTAASVAGVEVRELDTPAAAAAAANLFCAIWRAPDEAAPLSADLMRALNTTGNYVAGAFTGDTLVGAAVAFYTDENPTALHSHICGVAGGMQGRSVGFALKLHQRAWALHRNIAMISWTADPLVRRNIYFNLAKLGATVTAYLPDFYGPMRDGLNAGDPSDRLLLTWSLSSDHVTTATEGHPHILTIDSHPLLTVTPQGAPLPPTIAAPTLRCELPTDIVALRRTQPELATTWRIALRTALTTAIADGYRVIGVDKNGSYLLAR
jgi:predicted GNAT superfamily acetyltransferase